MLRELRRALTADLSPQPHPAPWRSNSATNRSRPCDPPCHPSVAPLTSTIRPGRRPRVHYKAAFAAEGAAPPFRNVEGRPSSKPSRRVGSRVLCEAGRSVSTPPRRRGEWRRLPAPCKAPCVGAGAGKKHISKLRPNAFWKRCTPQGQEPPVPHRQRRAGPAAAIQGVPVLGTDATRGVHGYGARHRGPEG